MRFLFCVWVFKVNIDLHSLVEILLLASFLILEVFRKNSNAHWLEDEFTQILENPGKRQREDADWLPGEVVESEDEHKWEEDVSEAFDSEDSEKAARLGNKPEVAGPQDCVPFHQVGCYEHYFNLFTDLKFFREIPSRKISKKSKNNQSSKFFEEVNLSKKQKNNIFLPIQIPEEAKHENLDDPGEWLVAVLVEYFILSHIPIHTWVACCVGIGKKVSDVKF